MQTQTREAFTLELPPVEQIKGELVQQASAEVPQDEVERFVQRILSVKPEEYAAVREAVDEAGKKELEASEATNPGMLKNKLSELAEHAGEESPVAKALIALRDQVAELNPTGVNFTPGWFARAFGWLPFVGNPIARYFNKFETGQGVINEILQSLKHGQAMLENDTKILAQDQARYRVVTEALRKKIAFLQDVAERLQAEVDRLPQGDHRTFIESEVLFPLLQRIQDLQQRLAVNQQGIIAAEILIRSNRELVRGVDRARLVTVDALRIAVSTALALNRQKLVLDAVEGLNSTTDALIASNAERLATQGAAIQRQATSAMLKVETLKQAFDTLEQTVDELQSFRQQALPQVWQNIRELSELSDRAQKKADQMQAGRQMSENL